MPLVVPAVLTGDPADFGQKLRKLSFAKRLHIDIAAPPFSATRTIGLAQVHLPEKVDCDLHLMIEYPDRQAETIISLHPHLAIVHFEAQGNLKGLFAHIGQVGIKKGLAILPETTAAQAADLIRQADHVLVFTGSLGHYGGQLQVDCLEKIEHVKQINPGVEISVDGGVSPDNIGQVAEAGADIIISGGFVANAGEPKSAYRILMEAIP